MTKNIMLVCGAGASTGMLAQRMEKVAKEQGKDYKLWAISLSALRHQLDEPDVILLGPQVTFMFDQVKEMVKEKGIPTAIINMQDYGMCDAPKVLAAAEKLMEEAEKEK